MTHTFTTRLDIYGDDAEVQVDFTYSTRHRELLISGVVTRIDDRWFPVWHLLSQAQRAALEERCLEHYTDVQQEIAETRAEGRYEG